MSTLSCSLVSVAAKRARYEMLGEIQRCSLIKKYLQEEEEEEGKRWIVTLCFIIIEKRSMIKEGIRYKIVEQAGERST